MAASREIGGGEIFLRLVDYYARQLEQIGVTVRLETEATGRSVSAFAPEVCVVATGAAVAVHPVARQAPQGVTVWHADDAEDPPAGDKVVVLGVDRTALVAAEVLAQQGRDVTMVAGQDKPAWDVPPTFKWRHAAWVEEFGITPENPTGPPRDPKALADKSWEPDLGKYPPELRSQFEAEQQRRNV